jgi:thiol:disulfide interchange protein
MPIRPAHTFRSAAAAALAALVCAAPARASSPAPDTARAQTALQGGEPRVGVRLLAHPDDTGPSRRVGLLLEIAPGWHVYGPDPGETGLPTTVQWEVETGQISPLPWPPARDFDDPVFGLVSRGYEGRALLPARVRFDGAPGRVVAQVDLLACGDECIPGSVRLELPAAGGTAGLEADAARALFEPSHRAPAARLAATARLLALALLGGLLLNLMPCVLPVLAIKALALAEISRGGRRVGLALAAAYSAGILASMLVLAAAVLALRAAGHAVGWGFQFQEPLYLAAVGALLVLFAANLFGVFEIEVDSGRLADLGAQAVGARRSFFDGLLTVALATPCSAPFLGTAVGAALAGSAAQIAGVFAAIGMGLAAPIALVAAVPGAARRLPRPGPWMLELRGGLGFALLAAAVWVVWITGRLAGAGASAALLAWLLAVGFAAWLLGSLQRRGRAPRPLLALALAGVALTGGLLVLRPQLVTATPARAPAAPFDRAAIARELTTGRPVFAYFTADWCITCKVNERLVLRDAQVRDALAAGGFAVFVGDYTRRDAELAAELARFGRSGVPLYAVYDPAAPDAAPRLLPEILSVDLVLDALRAVRAAPAVTALTPSATRRTMQRRRRRTRGRPRRACAARGGW